MKNLITSLASIACLVAAPALASDKELADLNGTVFASIDLNGNGSVSMREVEHFHDLVMLSMDYNEDEEIDESEFLGWDFGWLFLAEKRGLTDAYRASRVEIFNTWDTNGDGRLSQQEQDVEQAKKAFGLDDSKNEDMNLEGFVENMPLVATLNRVFN